MVPPPGPAVAVKVDLRFWRCPHCDSTNRLLEGTRGRQVLDVGHDPDCPDYVPEDVPAAEYAAEDFPGGDAA